MNKLTSALKKSLPKGLKSWLRPLLYGPAEPEVVRGARPRMLSVEPTSRCNLNCPFCLVGLQNSLPSTEHDLLPRGFGYMDMDLFEKIVKDAAAFGTTILQLHFQGEPLLHRDFPEMVRIGKKSRMETRVFTNGLALTETKANAILDAGLDLMRFSVDGATEGTYQKNRVGGKFARVHENMKMMAELSRRRKSSIQLEWQMIALQNNEHEIEMAERYARDIGIRFFVKTFAVTDPDLAPSNPKYRRQLHPKPCLDIYRAIFVYYNGDVVPCCYDQEGACVVGNLGESTLEEVWESENYSDLRRRIDEADIHPEAEPGICKNCLKWGPAQKESAKSGPSDEASDHV